MFKELQQEVAGAGDLSVEGGFNKEASHPLAFRITDTLLCHNSLTAAGEEVNAER